MEILKQVALRGGPRFKSNEGTSLFSAPAIYFKASNLSRALSYAFVWPSSRELRYHGNFQTPPRLSTSKSCIFEATIEASSLGALNYPLMNTCSATNLSSIKWPHTWITQQDAIFGHRRIEDSALARYTVTFGQRRCVVSEMADKQDLRLSFDHKVSKESTSEDDVPQVQG